MISPVGAEFENPVPTADVVVVSKVAGTLTYSRGAGKLDDADVEEAPAGKPFAAAVGCWPVDCQEG